MKKIIAYSLSSLLAFVVVSNIWIVLSSKSRIYDSLEEVPETKTGLILGTSKRIASGQPNEFFANRMDAAAELYHKGKIEKFVISGHKASVYYDEPRDMMQALQERGVPGNRMTLDTAGLRTLDSVIRCRQIYGQKEVIIVTQRFHAYRTLFIADQHDLAATVYAAKNPNRRFVQVMLRELVARPLAVLDLYIWNTQPELLGDPVFIP